MVKITISVKIAGIEIEGITLNRSYSKTIDSSKTDDMRIDFINHIKRVDRILIDEIGSYNEKQKSLTDFQ